MSTQSLEKTLNKINQLIENDNLDFAVNFVLI